MVRTLKWLAAAAIVLLLGVFAVYLSSRAMRPSTLEQEAMALIDAPPVQTGVDGFAELYAVARDVPKTERARLLAEDLRRFAARPPQKEDGASAPGWRSALEDWPALGESRAGDPAWCSLRESGCLSRVRASPQAYAGMLERNAASLDRAADLSIWDHFANPFPPRLDMPLPAYQPLTRLNTRNAWLFAQGKIHAGLAGACAGVAQGRKMIVSGDNLISSMIGAALVQGHATLLADMLAELPRNHVLPMECQSAFVLPLPAQDGVCRSMLGEARFVTGGMRSQVSAEVAGGVIDKEMPRWMSRLFFDPERTVARMAPKFAWYCGEQARALQAQDRPLVDPARPPTLWSLQCASNAVGCILADIAQPAYSDYGLRLQDADARLRVMAALLQLREQQGPVDPAALAGLPASLRSPTRALRLDLESGTLGTAIYEKRDQGSGRHDGTWSVPLPASRLQSAGASPRAGRR